MIRVAIFGANGKTGRHIVEQALSKGYEVVAFVYDAELDFDHDNLSQIVGDVTKIDDVRRAIKSSDAVVSALGHSPKTIRRNPTMHQDGIANIVDAMSECGVKRIVSLTGSGVRHEEDRPGFTDRLLNMGLSVVAQKMIDDGRAHADIIKKSQLEWTIVRALKLANGPKTGSYTVSEYVRPRMKAMVKRGDVADFMISNLETDKYLSSMPVVYGER